ncbi:gag-pol polyprotein [Tanacetum coccineum]
MLLALQKMVTLCVVKQRLQMKAGRDLQIFNDHELKIIGIGSIMVKMHDGTVCTVRDVRHVEGLKKNIVSLGQLDDLGCKVEIQNKIMKNIKGAFVLMRGENVAANLYQLKGEIIEEAEASVASHSPSHRVAVTWHQKLGHMSKQGMKIHVERKLLPGLIKASLPFCEHYGDVGCIQSRRSLMCLKFSKYIKRGQEGIKRQFTTAVELKISMEMWSGKPVNYSDLHIFRSLVVKGYCLWDPTAHKVVVSRDVVFMDDKIQENEEGDITTRETTSIQTEKEFQSNDSFEPAPEKEVNETNDSQAPVTRTLNRERKHLGWHSDYVMESNIAYCLLTEKEEPSTLQEALNNPDASFWKAAMQEEIKALHKNKTWELMPLRGVVKGYAQKEGIDFNEIFSHVVQMTTVRVVLAMCATYDLHLKQLHFFMEILKKKEEFNMLQPEGFEQKGKENLVYRLNKSLYGLKQASRPNIVHAVGVVSRYMVELRRKHWEAVKRILIYIKGTSNVALCFRESDLIVKGYVDSDYAGDIDGNKSTTAYMFALCGGTISWVSKLLLVVAMSTTEVEYVAATQASKETVWLKMLLEELGHRLTLFCDNQSALYLARNLTFPSKTKHIRVQYHFVHGKVEEGTVDMQKIHTDDNVADYLTKAINCDKFIWCRSSCGLAETYVRRCQPLLKKGKMLEDLGRLSGNHVAKESACLLRRGQKRDLNNMTYLQIMVNESHLSVREKHTFVSKMNLRTLG